MPENAPYDSEIISTAESRRKQQRVSRIMGLRDVVQPQLNQTARDLIYRMSGGNGNKPLTTNDPTRQAQEMPNQGKEYFIAETELFTDSKGRRFRRFKRFLKKHRGTLGFSAAAVGIFGGVRAYSGIRRGRSQVLGIAGKSDHGFPPKDEDEEKKPDAKPEGEGEQAAIVCPHCGGDIGEVVDEFDSLSDDQDDGNEAIAQPQSGAERAGLPPHEPSMGPGQPMVQSSGAMAQTLQIIQQLPVEQLDPLKRAIDQRLQVERAPLRTSVPPEQQDPVAAAQQKKRGF